MVNAGHQQIQAKDRQQEGRDASVTLLSNPRIGPNQGGTTRLFARSAGSPSRKRHLAEGATFVLSMWSVLEFAKAALQVSGSLRPALLDATLIPISDALDLFLRKLRNSNRGECGALM